MIGLAILLLTFVPGVALGGMLVRRTMPGFAWLSLAGAMGLLWSILATLILTLARVPLSPLLLVVVGIAPFAPALLLRSARAAARDTARRLTWNPRDVLLWILTVAFLAIPLVTVHDQMPTGDVQKSLLWAERVVSNRALPDYGEARNLNRDPADFLTPGLHTLTAAVGVLAGDPLRGSAWFSFAISIILAGLAAALASLATDTRAAPVLAFLFAALSPRFLRYAFAPGYHYQNLIGETLLFLALALFFLGMREAAGGSARRAFAAAAIAVIALPFVHQFSAFLAVFLAAVTSAAVLIPRRRSALSWWASRRPPARRRLLLLAIAFAGGVALMIARSPLREKLPHLLTPAPHLAPFLIPFSEIPRLLGGGLVFLGLAGIIAALLRRRALDTHGTLLPLAVFLATILALSQGPRLFLDIPSARTLFTAALPLSVFAGTLLAWSGDAVRARAPRFGWAASALLLTLALAPHANVASATLSATTHDARVNATLTPHTQTLLAFLRARCPTSSRCPGGILVDDWNRRRLTWTILSPYRMLTRVGGDLRVIADEASQSETRRTLYENHLDYEKLFMLGNSPLVVPLMDTHGIAFIGTARGVTDDVFSRNPALREVLRTPEAALYERTAAPPADEDAEKDFLLARGTLANDVGDAEDVLPHSALSLQSVTLSEPLEESGRPVRRVARGETTLRLNVGTYARLLWDADRDAVVDRPVTLLVRGRGAGASIGLSHNGTRLGTMAFPSPPRVTDRRVDIPGGTLRMDDKGFVEIVFRVEGAPLTVDLVAAGIAGDGTR